MTTKRSCAAAAAALTLSVFLTGCGPPPAQAQTFAAADTDVCAPGQYVAETQTFAGPVTSIASDGIVTIEAGALGDVACITDSATVMVNGATGRELHLTELRPGDWASVSVSRAMTRSLPPQTMCYALISGLEDGPGSAMYLEAREVTQQADGTLTVLSENSDLIVVIPGRLSIERLGSDSPASRSEIVPGSRLVVWADDLTLGQPAEAEAVRAVFCPRDLR